MRLDILNKSSDNIFKNFTTKNRNIVKNSIRRNKFRLKKGNTKEFIDDFYKVFAQIMYKHGTPVYDKNLFFYLVDTLQEDVCFYIVYEEGNLVAAMCMIFDKDIAWYPWGGVFEQYNKKSAGYYMYWKMIEDVVSMKRFKVIDFGRSGFGGGTYKFKKKFGTYPVKIDILKDKEFDIYSKYSFASNIWKKLPKNLVDVVGPKLCKYLEDL